jgi:ABC-type polysaccharide/polyol phosphate transport system ATPase subunit
VTQAIIFDHVTKAYRGSHTYRVLRDDVTAGVDRLIGLRRKPRGEILALDDVSFEITVGESTALIGLNGAGKTTALKIASRISYPTAGKVRVQGRVGALIEVGTGMHPELTGRENIDLYGRILGLSRADIARRFEEIVEFAEIAPALDRPVKQYSSGMQLRLGFSLASHLEPDILLVDEAIAVGDAGFQYRCLERMQEVVRSGITLIFVSHVPSLISSACRTGILLDRGRLAEAGDVDRVLASYLKLLTRVDQNHVGSSSKIILRSWDWKLDKSGARRSLGDLTISIAMDVVETVTNPRFGLAIGDGRGGSLIACSMLVDGYEAGQIKGPTELSCRMQDVPLAAGAYPVWISAMADQGITYLVEPVFLGFVFLGDGNGAGSRFSGTSSDAAVQVAYLWTLRQPPGSAAKAHAATV